MKLSRREFVATSLAGAAGFCVGGSMTESSAAESVGQLPDEDGYKLWLRYVPPGDVGKSYSQIVRQIRVEGASATAGIIRDELRSAMGAMLANAVPQNENELEDGTLIVGTPGNSPLVRGLNWSTDLNAAGN